MKKLSEEEAVKRVAYEVSVSKLELMDDLQIQAGYEDGYYQVLTT